MTRLIIFFVVALTVGCTPCSETDAPSSTISCGISDGGYVLAERPHVALEAPDLVSCVATLNGGTLSFVTRTRVCTDNSNTPTGFAICEVPVLPAGEYDLPGGDVLSVPADGGVPSCRN